MIPNAPEMTEEIARSLAAPLSATVNMRFAPSARFPGPEMVDEVLAALVVKSPPSVRVDAAAASETEPPLTVSDATVFEFAPLKVKLPDLLTVSAEVAAMAFVTPWVTTAVLGALVLSPMTNGPEIAMADVSY